MQQTFGKLEERLKSKTLAATDSNYATLKQQKALLSSTYKRTNSNAVSLDSAKKFKRRSMNRTIQSAHQHKPSIEITQQEGKSLLKVTALKHYQPSFPSTSKGCQSPVLCLKQPSLETVATKGTEFAMPKQN